MAPSSVSSGPASFLNLLEAQLLLATKAGVSVVQAVGNAGPDANTVVSFSPWILSVAASMTDRTYRKSIVIGNGKVFSCGVLSGNSCKLILALLINKLQHFINLLAQCPQYFLMVDGVWGM
jgi:hypothetical protein